MRTRATGVLVWVRARGDLLFAATFAVGWLVGLVASDGRVTPTSRPHLAVLTLLGLAQTVPFAWRRKAPATVAVTVFSAGLVQALAFLADPSVGFVLVALLASYSLGAHAPPRVSFVAAVAALAMASAISGLTSTESLTSTLLTPLVFVAVPWALGRVVSRLRLQRSALLRLNVRLEHESEDAARASVLEERSRIARELHDIVAHSISVMVIQAGAAEQLVDQGSRAREPLDAIRTTGQQALVEMRHLLGVLRADDTDASVLSPQPGLARVADLVDQVRRDGIEVTYEVTGTPVTLAPGLEIAAYRLVQEALSNVRKHARATKVEVTVSYEPDFVRTEVTDDGAGSDQAGEASSGHGLIGMRERVLIYGGTLSIGAHDGPGWRVSARLPLRA